MLLHFPADESHKNTTVAWLLANKSKGCVTAEGFYSIIDITSTPTPPCGPANRSLRKMKFRGVISHTFNTPSSFYGGYFVTIVSIFVVIHSCSSHNFVDFTFGEISTIENSCIACIDVIIVFDDYSPQIIKYNEQNWK